MVDASTDERRRPAVVARAMRRRWRTVAGITLTFAVLTVAYAASGSRSSTAAATVFIRPLVGNAFTSDALSNSQVTTVALNTEASLVDSSAVTKLVNAKLGTHLSARSATVHASVPVNTQLVVVTANANSAGTARKYADAYAAAFLDYRKGLATASQRTQLAQLKAQANDARTRLEEAAAATHLKNAPADAGAELQLASAQLSSIQNAIGQAQSIDTNPGSVVKPAHVAATSLLSSPAVIVFGGLVFGLVLGWLLAVWREIRDDRLHAADDFVVEGVPVLAVVPPKPNEPSVRDARTGLIAAVQHGAVLAIAPLGPGEVEPAANFAVALARSLDAAGYRVALVDAEISQPRVADLLDLGDCSGLSDVIAKGTAAPLAVRAGGIRVVVAGSQTADARERYGGTAMADAIAAVRAGADYTLVVTPALDTSDGVAVLHAVEKVVLVCTDGVSRRMTIRTVTETLVRLARPPAGLVAVTARARKATPQASGHAHEARTEEPAEPDAAAEAARPDGDHESIETAGAGAGRYQAGAKHESATSSTLGHSLRRTRSRGTDR